jgi:acyl dehydratase
MTRDYYYEDFPQGEVFISPEWEATAERITDFASKYDAQYFHLDAERARESFFGGLVCSGFQTAALGWTLALQTGMFEKCAVAGIGVDELRWFLPVREGDRVRVEFGLIEGRPSRSKPGIASVVFAYTMLNQRDETVMTMKLLQLVRRRPVREA